MDSLSVLKIGCGSCGVVVICLICDICNGIINLFIWIYEDVLCLRVELMLEFFDFFNVVFIWFKGFFMSVVLFFYCCVY